MATMLDYINEEHETLKNILVSYDFSKDPQYEKMETIMILATGSSFNACLSAKLAFEKLADVAVTIEEPYNFNHYGRLAKGIDAVIGVSQSGKSASTIDALKELKGTEIQRIVLTSDPQSPITSASDKIIDLQMGIETVGFVTKGFTATMLHLMLLAIKIGVSKHLIDETELKQIKDEISMAIEMIPQVITKTEDFFNREEDSLKLGGRFVTIGYGPNWGTAKEFETKFTETVRRPSHGVELEAYMHGPYLEADWEHTLFFIEASSENKARSQALREYMKSFVGKVYTITTDQSSEENMLGLDVTVSEWLSPLLLIIPFQILAYKTATAKGINLGVRIFDDFDDVLKSKI